MADSNRYHGQGHVSENRELLIVPSTLTTDQRLFNL